MICSPAIGLAPPALAELAGAASPLLTQLGVTGTASEFAAATLLLGATPVRTPDEMTALLLAYRERLLFPVELPVIARAAGHAAAGFGRELAALDRETDVLFPPGPFREASRTVGHAQLRRLRPLRDVRVVQRYLEAVDAGASPGRHVVVYGLLLATFSLPLRPGIAHYAHAAHGGLARSGVAALGLNGDTTARLDAALESELPARLAAILPRPDWLPAAGTVP